MKKTSVSVRLSSKARVHLGREVVRLTINPALLAVSRRFVDFSGREQEGDKLRASELVMRARARFPELPLSWAVEGYMALLLSQSPARLRPFSVEPYEKLDESARRFRTLSPAAKIRLGRRWTRELRQLREAR